MKKGRSAKGGIAPSRRKEEGRSSKTSFPEVAFRLEGRNITEKDRPEEKRSKTAISRNYLRRRKKVWAIGLRNAEPIDVTKRVISGRTNREPRKPRKKEGQKGFFSRLASRGIAGVRSISTGKHLHQQLWGGGKT